jgi:Type II secretion system (T2SS), protein M subtype b
MPQNSRFYYRVIRWTVATILVADLILVGVNLRLAQSPRVSASDLRRLELAEKSYRADTARLQKFRDELPADEKQWDEFYTASFRAAGSGYSAISADLGELSRSAGLVMDTISFRQHNPDARGLVQVDISTAVEGNYESLISFLDKLEHSENFYVLDSLALGSSNTGRQRLNLQLRSYFRT